MNAATLFVILLTAALFLAASLNLALDTRVKSRVTGASACFAVVAGVSFYGYAYALREPTMAVAVLKALLTVCRMFGGVNDYGAVAQTPLFRSNLIVGIFWFSHFLAFYVTASAAIEVLGRRLLKLLRLRLLWRGALTVVYGASGEDARLIPRGGRDRAIVVLAPTDDAERRSVAEALGAVLFTGPEALSATPGFLKRIGADRRGRALDVCCLDPDAGRSLRFAEALRDALSACGKDGAEASLFLLGVPEARAFPLLAQPGQGGYGAVFACTRQEMIARMAFKALPPWRCVGWDALGRAREDYRVAIVGFGRMGREALRQSLLQGQMEGGVFHARVFDPRVDALKGYVEASFPEVLEAYDIAFEACGAASGEFYRALQAFEPQMIVLCTGSRGGNAEVADDLERFYRACAIKPHILQLTAEAAVIDGEARRPDAVDARGLDRGAMIINHMYCRGASAEEDWRACTPFNRASSRASADFAVAFLHAAGMTREEALRRWPPEAAVLENLARTEHRRWCAFYRVMGYRRMDEAELEARCARRRNGEPLRVSRNDAAWTHACLVPWEALDDLSERESAATGGRLDYKAMDVNNVLALPALLKLEDER